MSKPEKLRVVLVEPGRYAREATVDKTLPQELAEDGGLIDAICLWPEDNVCLILNDTGTIMQTEPNRELPEYGGIAFGTFFLCGEKGEDFCSLTDEQVARYLERFCQPELFVPYQNGTLSIPYDRPDLSDAPASVQQAYTERHGLPALCFATLKGIEGVMLLRYGERRYLPLGKPPEGMTASRYADLLNAELGVSREQQLAMLNGALFGWDGIEKVQTEQGVSANHRAKEAER